MYQTTAYDLDWGNFTPEGFSAKEGTVMHVFNFDISSDEKINRCIIFSTGRILWAQRQIPKGTKQKITFDLRGQPIPFLTRAKKMTATILDALENNLEVENITIEILI